MECGRRVASAMVVAFAFLFFTLQTALSYPVTIRVEPKAVHYVQDLDEYWAEVHVTTEAYAPYTLIGYVNGNVRYMEPRGGNADIDLNLTLGKSSQMVEGKHFDIVFEAKDNTKRVIGYSNRAIVEYHDGGGSEFWTAAYAKITSASVQASRTYGYVDVSGRVALAIPAIEYRDKECEVVTNITLESGKTSSKTVPIFENDWVDERAWASISFLIADQKSEKGTAKVSVKCRGDVLDTRTIEFNVEDVNPENEDENVPVAPPGTEETVGITLERGNGLPSVRATREGNIVYVPVTVRLTGMDTAECEKKYGNSETLITISRDGAPVAEMYGTRLTGGECSAVVHVPLGRIEEVNDGRRFTLRAELRKPEKGYWVTVAKSGVLYVKVWGENAEHWSVWSEGEKEGPNTSVEVHVDSPYRYEYRVVDGEVQLILHVNYTARNSCYGIYTEVEQGSCEGCYTVRVIEKKPEKGMMCAQVIRNIPTVSAHIPIPKGVRTIWITVTSGTGKGGINLPSECIALEGKIVQVGELLRQSCVAGECDKNLSEEYNRLAERYRKICGKEPPRIAPPREPEPPKRPIILPPGGPKIPIHLPVNVRVREENGKIVVEGNVARVVVDLNLEFLQTRVDLNVDHIHKKIREKAKVENIKKIVLRKGGTGPIYVAEGEKEGRLLGIIPIKLHIQVIASAENGEVISVRKPWWSFLVWG